MKQSTDQVRFWIMFPRYYTSQQYKHLNPSTSLLPRLENKPMGCNLPGGIGVCERWSVIDEMLSYCDDLVNDRQEAMKSQPAM